MKSRRTVLVAGFLGLVIVVAVGLQGPATFTGMRWSFEIPTVETERPAETGAEASAAPEPLPTPRPAPDEAGSELATVILVIIGAIAVIIALVLLRRWLARRSPRFVPGLRDVGALTTPSEPIAEPDPAREPEAPAVLRGVDEALRLLGSEREPGDAVMKAWLGLERSAEDSGITRSRAETPTEFTRGILSRVSADDRAVASLLSLYLRARFGHRPVTAADVSQAREALEALARSWEDDTTRMTPAATRPGAPRSAGPTTWRSG